MAITYVRLLGRLFHSLGWTMKLEFRVVKPNLHNCKTKVLLKTEPEDHPHISTLLPFWGHLIDEISVLGMAWNEDANGE